MKALVKKFVQDEVNLKYFVIDCEPRYWEDSEINGQDDTDTMAIADGKGQPGMPFAYYDKEAKVWKWKIKINVDTGYVQGWPNEITADIHYKVCDQGEYWFEDAKGKKCFAQEIGDKTCDYVPSLIDFYGDSYGDYIVMTIESNGHVKEWDLKRVQPFIDELYES